MTVTAADDADAPSHGLIRRFARLLSFALAVFGALAGAYIFVLHAVTDPLTDTHAYYDAGARLNAGRPLYEQDASTSGSHYYFYPPLLAILFRPLALLPYEMAAAVWGSLVVASFAATVWWLGFRNRWTWLALGWLAAPLAWGVVIAQAHVPVVMLLALGTPASVAVAAHLKVFPVLVSVYWLGRRDWGALAKFVLWFLALSGLSFAVEPAGTIGFLSFPDLSLVGEVTNLSLYAVSPALWAGTLAVLLLAAVLLARTRFGWLAALALSVFASPRLLLYQLSSLLAAVRSPGSRSSH